MLDTVLSNIRVIDLTQNVAGPYCTQILGDMGADIIKVERPGRGDDTRDWRPPVLAGTSPTFLALNRNKRSICIDINDTEGAAILHRLAASADVFIHSMKPGSAEARGLGYEALSDINPRLVYGAISAFGSEGPLSSLPGYDPLMQAFTGIMSTTGNEGDDPVRVSVSLIDMGTGMWAAQGILAALLARQNSGHGTLVEASLMETGIGWMTVFIANFGATGTLPRKLGSAMAMTAPYELFRSADGHVFIAAGNDRLFRQVCSGLDVPQLADDPRFATNADRVKARNALHEEIEAVTLTRRTADIVMRLRQAGAPCSELNNVGQMLSHEQVAASGIIHDLPIEGAPDHKVVGLPLKLSGQAAGVFKAPPALGADTSTILAELGLDDSQIEQLRESRVVA